MGPQGNVSFKHPDRERLVYCHRAVRTFYLLMNDPRSTALSRVPILPIFDFCIKLVLIRTSPLFFREGILDLEGVSLQAKAST